MQITSVTVTLSQTVQVRKYEPLDITVSITAEPGDMDSYAVLADLRYRCQAEIDAALREVAARRAALDEGGF